MPESVDWFWWGSIPTVGVDPKLWGLPPQNAPPPPHTHRGESTMGRPPHGHGIV